MSFHQLRTSAVRMSCSDGIVLRRAMALLHTRISKGCIARQAERMLWLATTETWGQEATILSGRLKAQDLPQLPTFLLARKVF